MPLIECPECKKQVSSEARSCPVCGYPVAEKVADAAMARGETPPGARGELIREVRPSWWAYFWHLFFFWLIVPPIIAIFSRSATALRIYTDRITVERGIFSKCYQDYSPKDIRSIDVDQSFLMRMVGIGDLTISTSATVEASEKLSSIPDPRGVRELIMAQRLQ
jgi:hypothetical protein